MKVGTTHAVGKRKFKVRKSNPYHKIWFAGDSIESISRLMRYFTPVEIPPNHWDMFDTARRYDEVGDL
ncbi:MAG: hypothetical protein AAFY36_16945, partial [Bacteroidota bacterium]